MAASIEDENSQQNDIENDSASPNTTQNNTEEDLLTIEDYLKDTNINRSNIRCISTSILSICGFLLPILFGVFYFIIKDSYDIKAHVSPFVIIALAVATCFLSMAILSSVDGVRVRNPPTEFSSKWDRYSYLKSLEDQERASSEKSIRNLKFALIALGVALILFYINLNYTSICELYYNFSKNQTMPESTALLNPLTNSLSSIARG
jgi:hypothetical protein